MSSDERASVGAAPIDQTERDGVVDALRGFALFGVLLVNLQGWVVFALPEDLAAPLRATVADRLTLAVVEIFADAKFITLFSLLFGYGFGLILERVGARGVAFAPFFARRMTILLAAGLLHLGWWWGEILSSYAICGLLLLLFRGRDVRTLAAWGLFFLLVVTPAIQAGRMWLLPPAGGALDVVLHRFVAAVQAGHPGEILAANYRAAAFVFLERGAQWRDTAEILGKFLLGYAALRGTVLADTPDRRARLQRAWRFFAAVGALYLTGTTWLQLAEPEIAARPLQLGLFVAQRVGVLGLALFYATSLVRLVRAGRLRALFAALRPVGAMSLTNYLTHTVCYTVIYYGCGFGAIGRLHLQWTLPLAVGIFALQIALSRAWLAHHRYGPVEWLWRMASYGKILPLRRA